MKILVILEFDKTKQRLNVVEFEELITVCDKCLRASCWKGIFLCDEARNAGTIDIPKQILTRMEKEDSHYWEK